MSSFDCLFPPKSGILPLLAPSSCVAALDTRCSSVSTNLGDMANPGVGAAVYDKITNVVTWKADKIAAGTEALIRITMMQGSEEPLSINVQVGA